MANVIRLKLQHSDNGDNICVWLDSGDVEIFPVNDKTQTVIDAFMAGEIATDELVEKCTELTDVTVAAKAASAAVRTRLEKVSDHLSCDGMHVYYDGSAFERIQLDPALEKHLIRLMTERNQSESAMHDWKCYAAFAENLYSNVTPYIREQLVTWMEAQDWMIFTEDGCFIGYRGCQKNAETGIAESIHEGPGIVNGEIYNGHIPNPDGGIVEIARDLVEDNPAVGCASGMHVGTYDYAKGWGRGILLRVKVNPRDVISVPTECSAQKIRCCRFEVLDHTEFEYSERDIYDRGQLSWHDDEDDLTEEERDELINEAYEQWEPTDCYDYGEYDCDCAHGGDCDECHLFEAYVDEYIADHACDIIAEREDDDEPCGGDCGGCYAVCDDRGCGTAEDDEEFVTDEVAEPAADNFFADAPAPTAPATPEAPVTSPVTAGEGSTIDRFAKSIGVEVNHDAPAGNAHNIPIR